MADSDKIETRFHYEYIHNTIAHFFSDTLDYFSTYLQPRVSWKVVSTYHKAVELFNKKDQYNRETDQPQLPALILDPTEFNIADTSKQFFRYPNLSPGFAKRVFDPIYQSEDVIITVAFQRIKGEINLIYLNNSFYEFCDFKMFMFNIFGGQDRIIYPRNFNSFIVIPPELYNYQYINDVTGLTYNLDWTQNGVYSSLIKSINRDEYVYPCTITPWYKLTNVSDGSERYGGSSSLAKWRLNSTIEYEIEIPNYIILESDYLLKNIKFNIKYGSSYSQFLNAPEDTIQYNQHIEWNSFDSTSSIDIINGTFFDPTDYTLSNSTTNITFKERMIYTIDSTSIGNVDIILPYAINPDLIRVYGKYGELTYYSHYRLSSDGLRISFNTEDLNLDIADVLEFHFYQYL